jgi:hypothetical protein
MLAILHKELLFKTADICAFTESISIDCRYYGISHKIAKCFEICQRLQSCFYSYHMGMWKIMNVEESLNSSVSLTTQHWKIVRIC